MYVNIKNGSHRGHDVNGVFPLVKQYSGRFVTVKTNAQFPFMVENARVIVGEDDFEYCSGEGVEVDVATMVTSLPGAAGTATITNYEQEFIAQESDEAADKRISHTFEMLEKVADATQQGLIRGLVVCGPPGIGKSFGIEKVLKEANLFNVVKNQDPNYEIVKGKASALGLYKTLYNFRGFDQTIVFDDCDDILREDTSLNLLKAALDSGDKRRLNWRTESKVLAEENIPTSFEFEGSVMFLTNVDFENTKESRIKQHTNAILSRCHYLDLNISNTRDKLIRIRQVIKAGMLNKYNFSEEQQIAISDYVNDNAESLHELSLRMVKKIADFVKMAPDCWKDYVEETCLKREAKFKRLLDNIKAQ